MKKQTILLVDDDPDYLESNRAVLEAEGFDVHTAETAEQALKLARSLSPAVAILDVIMDEPDSGFKHCQTDPGEPRNAECANRAADGGKRCQSGKGYRVPFFGRGPRRTLASCRPHFKQTGPTVHACGRRARTPWRA